MKLRPVTHAIYEQLRLRFGRSRYYNAAFLAKATGYNPASVLFAIRQLKDVGKVHVRKTGKNLQIEARAVSAEPLFSPKTDAYCRCCFGGLGKRHAVCVECLPFDPAGSYEMSELGEYVDDCIEMKVRLYTERYAAGLAMSPEPYTSPVPSPGGANSERSYDDRHIPR